MASNTYRDYKAQAKLFAEIIFAVWSNEVNAKTWDHPTDKRFRIHFARTGKFKGTIELWQRSVPEPIQEAIDKARA